MQSAEQVFRNNSKKHKNKILHLIVLQIHIITLNIYKGTNAYRHSA